MIIFIIIFDLNTLNIKYNIKYYIYLNPIIIIIKY